jgi:hypothetical protein
MLAKAGEFSCQSTDIACLCKNPNFGYGIRDCSYQYCQNDTAAAQIVAFGVQYCASVGVTIGGSATVPVVTVSSISEDPFCLLKSN